jgi:hypothetical protein
MHSVLVAAHAEDTLGSSVCRGMGEAAVGHSRDTRIAQDFALPGDFDAVVAV